jgi:hypothetical protein
MPKAIRVLKEIPLVEKPVQFNEFEPKSRRVEAVVNEKKVILRN